MTELPPGEKHDVVRIPAYMMETDELEDWQRRLLRMQTIVGKAVEIEEGIMDINHILRMRGIE